MITKPSNRSKATLGVLGWSLDESNMIVHTDAGDLNKDVLWSITTDLIEIAVFLGRLEKERSASIDTGPSV